MAEQTGIEWCDATFNPWIGCEKVSPGCAHCYAETLVHGRMGRGGTWGADGVRQVTSDSNWKKPLRWARLAREGKLPDGTPNLDGRRPRVFCASLADVFEDRPELREPRDDLFTLIEQTRELDWLLLTKRAEFARDWIAALPLGEHGAVGFTSRVTIRVRELGFAAAFPNVWLGVSIENARHTWRADVLREIPAAVRFLSCEPLLGSLYPDLCAKPLIESPCILTRGHAGKCTSASIPAGTKRPLDLTGIDWVIVGGESGPGARPMQLEWAREIRDACLALCDDCAAHPEHIPKTWTPTCQRPAVFVKQLGAKPTVPHPKATKPGEQWQLKLRDRKGGDWDEWPGDLRIREFPASAEVPA